jgi:hypothetical protein
MIKLLSAATALGLAALASVSLSGCRDDLTENITVVCPDRRLYVQYVSEVMEKRCGTLDCHGSDYRPMRMFGRFGLRHPVEGNRTGEASTTDFEKSANYFALCAIEPEKIAKVVDDPGGNAVNTLLVVRKARGQEGHKGGRVFDAWDDSDRCVVGWLRGDAEQSVRDACAAAVAKLP